MLYCNVCLLRLYSLMTLQIEQRLCQHQQHGIKHKVIMLAIFIVIVFPVVIIKNLCKNCPTLATSNTRKPDCVIWCYHILAVCDTGEV